MGPLGENEGEETVPPALGPVAQPVEEGGADQEVVGVLPAPLTADEVAGAMLDPSAPDEEGGDEAAVGGAVEAAVSQFAEAVLERLDEIVDAAARPTDAVVMASAPSVDENETAGPAPQQVIEPVPEEAATAVETERQAATQVPTPEVVEHAPPVKPVVTERDMRVEFSRPVVEVSAAYHRAAVRCAGAAGGACSPARTFGDTGARSGSAAVCPAGRGAGGIAAG